MAIGSRPLKESKLKKHQPIWREALLGRSSNLLIQLIGIRGISDTQCGFKMFTRAAAQEVFQRCELNGFSFDFEALMIARDIGYGIDEVPIRRSASGRVQGGVLARLSEGSPGPGEASVERQGRPFDRGTGLNADEYTKMFQLEDLYWWFVGRAAT